MDFKLTNPHQWVVSKNGEDHMIHKEAERIILAAQKNEITEHVIYYKLARMTREPNYKEILKHISDDKLRHYEFWRKYTNKDVKSGKPKIFGMTFEVKLMERGEEKAQIAYSSTIYRNNVSSNN